MGDLVFFFFFFFSSLKLALWVGEVIIKRKTPARIQVYESY